ncbi:hypothetical protein SAMN05660284_01286 [Formivibrio citricus]|uniref:Lipoprotein n=2 Tax=Formivibrio citricus TaxID=83765 RepID=A0A1I4YAG4_9NEIS|nr:hypothetical protein SAMN05660284_01286 [Formivibrio citricus]
MRILAGLMLALLLSACATPLSLDHGRLAPPPGTGYVIAAVTLDSLNHRNADAGICLRGPARATCLESQISLGYIRAPGDEPDGVGSLHVVALPAGQYRVTEIYGSWLDDSFRWMAFRNRASFALDERFTLAPGQVVYLGDYHISLNFKPSYTRSDTRRRDFNDLRLRSSVQDFSNVTLLPVPTPK